MRGMTRGGFAGCRRSQFLKKYEKCNAGLSFASLFWYDTDGKVGRLYRASAQDIDYGHWA
jgi:hypothetical protein